MVCRTKESKVYVSKDKHLETEKVLNVSQKV